MTAKAIAPRKDYLGIGLGVMLAGLIAEVLA